MPSAERARDRGRRNARQLLASLSAELREARISSGLSQVALARMSGTSQSRISRFERGRRPTVDVDEVARLAAGLGLRLSLKSYPEGSPVRDAGQLRLIARIKPRVGAGFRSRNEALIGGLGDYRAWDVQLDGPGSIGVDAETQLRDVQAILRRSEAKWRDSGVDRIVLLVARTRHNRVVLREHREALRGTFPADTREILSAVREGRLPERNGIVVL
jgi:transcriptional regulator with XRE-family HTH domain